MPRPKGKDSLRQAIESLKLDGADCLVSLLEKNEEKELGLETESELCKYFGIEYLNFPIKDITTPMNENEFVLFANQIAEKLKNGKVVVIHCKMGIGRSSLLAAAVMFILGYEGDDVFETIKKYRKLDVPDTMAQRTWLLSLRNKLKKT